MAKAFFNYLAAGRGIADSAGTKPSPHVNPAVVQVMQEVGIDITSEQPKMLTPELLDKFDRVITMGCGVEESCPASYLPVEDWGLDDPAGQPLTMIRRIRDDIRARVEKLLNEP